MVDQKFTVIDTTSEVQLTIEERDYSRDLDILLDHPPPYEAVLRLVVSALEAAGVTVADRR